MVYRTLYVHQPSVETQVYWTTMMITSTIPLIQRRLKGHRHMDRLSPESKDFYKSSAVHTSQRESWVMLSCPSSRLRVGDLFYYPYFCISSISTEWAESFDDITIEANLKDIILILPSFREVDVEAPRCKGYINICYRSFDFPASY
jgi:hypothetical protein